VIALDGSLVKLKTARVLKGLSIAQLAERSKVAQRTIMLLEHGGTDTPRPNTVRKLADALEVDPREVDEFRAALGLD
jgi:transcriptional regulator with XRE-family HTH domain